MDLPCALQTIGSGLFMNCSRLKRLSFPGGINASVLLADLYQKLEVTVYTESRSIRLLFPEYAYEFEDVVMPRQFRTITYGSGGRYRECITGDTIDLELYRLPVPRGQTGGGPGDCCSAGAVPPDDSGGTAAGASNPVSLLSSRTPRPTGADAHRQVPGVRTGIFADPLLAGAPASGYPAGMRQPG